MLKQSQKLKQIQKITPGLIQNQKILAISGLALDNIIRKELETNPLLEEESEVSAETEAVPELAEAAPVSDTGIKDSDGESESEMEDKSIESKIENEYDWDEYFENEAEEYKNFSGEPRIGIDFNRVKENANPAENNLMLQLHLSELNNKEIFIGEEIIWSLNDIGYFSESEENILKDLDVKKSDTEFSNEEFTAEEINKVLNYIQMNFDPPGIAARNLKECLLIQIKRSDREDEIKNLALQITENNFDDFMSRKFEKVSRQYQLSLEKVNEIFDFIHNLYPKPGFSDTETEDQYIVPDLIVTKNNGRYEVYINETYSPSLRINKTYRDMYINGGKSLDKSTKSYLLNNFNKAKFFIDAINSRKDTMLKVMHAIIERQMGFFENNGEGLKPMYEKDIALDINMDSSTISRTVNGKYVQTDFGIYELRSFFRSPIHRTTGEDFTNAEIKIVIKDIINKEDKKNPLNDELIKKLLHGKGFEISRRTVAKYREALNIPVSKIRREIVK
ncbi:MAG: RNA polymerase sigma-54 factor [Ignavibacteria bacterium]|nr:RNA polymerase sigma-54 factor [Ignavibacteria bacterium]